MKFFLFTLMTLYGFYSFANIPTSYTSEADNIFSLLPYEGYAGYEGYTFYNNVEGAQFVSNDNPGLNTNEEMHFYVVYDICSKEVISRRFNLQTQMSDINEKLSAGQSVADLSKQIMDILIQMRLLDKAFEIPADPSHIKNCNTQLDNMLTVVDEDMKRQVITDFFSLFFDETKSLINIENIKLKEYYRALERKMHQERNNSNDSLY